MENLRHDMEGFFQVWKRRIMSPSVVLATTHATFARLGARMKVFGRIKCALSEPCPRDGVEAKPSVVVTSVSRTSPLGPRRGKQ